MRNLSKALHPVLVLTFLVLRLVSATLLNSPSYFPSVSGHVIDPFCTTNGLSISMTAMIGASVALQGHHGDTIVYSVYQVSLPASTDCPVTDGVVRITAPSGVVTTLATGIALGGSEPRTKSIGGGVSYVANHADEILVGGLHAWQATVEMAGTRHQANGLDGPASAMTTFGITALHSDTPTPTPTPTVGPAQTLNPFISATVVFLMVLAGTVLGLMLRRSRRR